MSNFLTRALIESDSNYVIERSLRFMAASSQYLTRTPSVAGNRKTWTLSTWVKRGQLGVGQKLFTTGTDISGNNQFGVGFLSSDKLWIFSSTSGVNLQLETTRLFRDPSAWCHIQVVLDTTNATSTERVILYVNGQRETAFSTATYPALNNEPLWNSTTISGIGRYMGSAGVEYADGYQTEINFIDGQALTPSSFGEINPVTGQWVAKKYTGTYGTNGFYLDFKDGTSTTTLGNDKSGNNNHWTLTNFTRSAGVNDCWMLDVPAGNGSASAVQPSGNYAVLNPLLPLVSGFTISKANLGYVTSVANNGHIRANFEISSGKWYWEYTVGSGNQADLHGVCKTTVAPNSIAWNEVGSVGYYALDGQKYVSGVNSAYGSSFTIGNVIGTALDKDAGTITFYKNGVSQGSIALPTSDTLVPYFADGSTGLATSGDVNFGQRSFAYTPPTGFKALCTANLPAPNIKKPSDHFNVQLSTGANIKTDSEALFTNELEWIKDRANANNHQLIDSVRGSNAVLQSNTTATETTYTAPSGSSVGWVWRASDSAAVTNSNGSISSQVSANVAAGFSVVTYTGTGVAATIGHGLGKAPALVIVKSRGGGGVNYQWIVQHKDVPATQLLLLNDISAAFTSSGFNNTYATSTVFSTNGLTGSGENLRTYVAYCFAEIAGYSKSGSYTGNGSADGAFVYLGFIPKLIIIKAYSSGIGWIMYDSARSSSNLVSSYLGCEASSAESALGGVDFCSNGFKIRSSAAGLNQNGVGFIYMAFAETPFNYANAR